ncbi:hypothetical protein BD626DRAFT_171401 [Schizophyllum amplum]|uniref:Uncharacterized protein n=1 Tax=Schizophyllum amplum TaxID=97359 RepID=A0A550CR81_9AGAR|nr:hypothetical protein BD626DRAFT_171401 [Auriculariopsis ampla]
MLSLAPASIASRICFHHHPASISQTEAYLIQRSCRLLVMHTVAVLGFTGCGNHTRREGSGGEHAGLERDDRFGFSDRDRPLCINSGNSSPWTVPRPPRYTTLAWINTVYRFSVPHPIFKVISGLARPLSVRASTCRSRSRLPWNITRSARLLRRLWHRQHHREHARPRQGHAPQMYSPRRSPRRPRSVHPPRRRCPIAVICERQGAVDRVCAQSHPRAAFS